VRLCRRGKTCNRAPEAGRTPAVPGEPSLEAKMSDPAAAAPPCFGAALLCIALNATEAAASVAFRAPLPDVRRGRAPQPHGCTEKSAKKKATAGRWPTLKSEG